MEDICLTLDIESPDLKDINNIHSHLVITPYQTIALKLYLPKNKIDEVFAWIQTRENYKDFGRSLTLITISDNTGIENIFFDESPIAMLGNGPHFQDNRGLFLAVGLKQITILYTNDHEEASKKQITDIYFDNNAYDLFYSFINIDAFQTNPKKWQSSPGIKGKFINSDFILDFEESIQKDKDNYPLVISRRPRIRLAHDFKHEQVLEYCKVLSALLSFYQGHEIDYNLVSSQLKSQKIIVHKPRSSKEKILAKDLGRFGIQMDLFEIMQNIQEQVLEKSDFLLELVRLINLGLQMDGTSRFMLVFTVIEKLRNDLEQKRENKEKFKFENNKQANKQIRDFLNQLCESVSEEQRELFQSTISDKLVNIKYIPQKDQFLNLFNKLNLFPNQFELDFKKIVSTRGSIFHGKYIDPDDSDLINMNRKLESFSANLLLNYCFLE